MTANRGTGGTDPGSRGLRPGSPEPDAPEATVPEVATAAQVTRLTEELNGTGTEALAGLGDREILAAWEDAVAAFLDPRSPERRELGERFVAATALSPAGVQAGLEAVLGGVRGESAARLFQRARDLRAGAPAVPRPFALVVLASNLPALAVQPLLPALAARRPVLLKSPTAEPWFAPAFARALARRLPALGESVAARTWPGGDEAVERPLLERAGVVVAYGGEEALASLDRRARALGDARVVLYGPRTSLAAVGPDADPGAVAPGLARDVALFDQRGCLSVAAVYVAGGEDRARALGASLARELGRLARLWPPGPPDPASAGAARQVRSEAEMRGLFQPRGTTGSVETPLAAGTVVVEPRPDFQPTPGLRTVRVHPLPDLNTLPELLAPWRGRLQGAALAAADRLEPSLAALGISRITAPGRLQHPDALWHNGGLDPLEALAADREEPGGTERSRAGPGLPT